MNARAHLSSCTLALALAGLAAPCWAQSNSEFPSRGVRIIVATSPGGALDATARAIGHTLSQAWDQKVVVDNRAGGNGAIAYDLLAKSPADGHF